MELLFVIFLGLLAVWIGSLLTGIAFGLLLPALFWALTGYLAGKLVRGRGYGLVGNLLLGLAGGFVGHFVFGLFGVGAGGFLGSVVAGVVGAVILVYAVRALGNPRFAR